MYKIFNPNPFASRVGDCVVRAVAKVTGKKWNQKSNGIHEIEKGQCFGTALFVSCFRVMCHVFLCIK